MISQKKLFNIYPRVIAYTIPQMIGYRIYLTEEDQDIRHILQVNGFKSVKRTGMTGVNLNLIKELGKK
jgi:hypothetical protein